MAVPASLTDRIRPGVVTTESRPKGMGWVPELPDIRDQTYRASRALAATTIPDRADLRNPTLWPDIYDQGSLGSCTAQAICALYVYLTRKQGQLGGSWRPSRLALYYCERLIQGWQKEDTGAYIRDGFKVLNRTGVGDEALYPHELHRFTRRPSNAYWKEANNHQALKYMRVEQTELSLLACLAEGFPVVFGFSVYSGFDSLEVARTGIGKLPAPGESQLGGHAVVAVGYDLYCPHYGGALGVLCRNSWGTTWGLEGYFWLPGKYVLDNNLSDDFWTARLVE